MITSKTRSAAVRERLKHPVIDGDGHTVEVMPLLHDYIREIGGPKVSMLPGKPAGGESQSRRRPRSRRRSRRLVGSGPAGAARPPGDAGHFWGCIPETRSIARPSCCRSCTGNVSTSSGSTTRFLHHERMQFSAQPG